MRIFILNLLLLTTLLSLKANCFKNEQLITMMNNCLLASDSLDLNHQLKIKIVRRLTQARNQIINKESLSSFFDADTVYIVQNYSDGYVSVQTWNSDKRSYKFIDKPNEPIAEIKNENFFSKKLLNLIETWDTPNIIKVENEIITVPTQFCYAIRIINSKARKKDIDCIFFILKL
jgi:hypothetical protein